MRRQVRKGLQSNISLGPLLYRFFRLEAVSELCVTSRVLDLLFPLVVHFSSSPQLQYPARTQSAQIISPTHQPNSSSSSVTSPNYTLSTQISPLSVSRTRMPSWRSFKMRSFSSSKATLSMASVCLRCCTRVTSNHFQAPRGRSISLIL